MLSAILYLWGFTSKLHWNQLKLISFIKTGELVERIMLTSASTSVCIEPESW
jgi:hypothetical protein